MSEEWSDAQATEFERIFEAAHDRAGMEVPADHLW